MTIENTRNVVTRYLSGEHSSVETLAPEVVFTLMATGQESHGPAEVLATLDNFYRVAFNAGVETRHLIFSEDHAVFEGVFVGEHTGEFAGIPATHRPVRVPLLVVYDVQGACIQAARIYFELPVLMAQLS